jgi:hypothetical protein
MEPISDQQIIDHLTADIACAKNCTNYMLEGWCNHTIVMNGRALLALAGERVVTAIDDYHWNKAWISDKPNLTAEIRRVLGTAR